MVGSLGVSDGATNSLRVHFQVVSQHTTEAVAVAHMCLHRVLQVKLLKCLVDNIVVDISFNQMGGLITLNFLEEINNLIGNSNIFKRSIILVRARHWSPNQPNRVGVGSSRTCGHVQQRVGQQRSAGVAAAAGNSCCRFSFGQQDAYQPAVKAAGGKVSQGLWKGSGRLLFWSKVGDAGLPVCTMCPACVCRSRPGVTMRAACWVPTMG